MKRYTIVGIIVVLMFPSSVNASSHKTMTFRYASMVAVDYWNKRNVDIKCHPTFRQLTSGQSLERDNMYGFLTNMTAHVKECLIEISFTSEAYRTDPDYDWIYCREIVHEFGHIGGIGHDYGGIMDASKNIVPWGCDHRKQFMRKMRRHKRR